MARLFGTDGVRGIANTELTCELAFKLGQAAVSFQGRSILIGKDTRLSGDMLEAAVAAGIMSKGGRALLAGIIPTPAIAFLVRELACQGGIMISASHNPPEYNGIKLFDGKGFKLSDELEDQIERTIRDDEASKQLVSGAGVGIAVRVENASELYVAHAVSTVEKDGIDFSGLKIALDVGHGASYKTSTEALRRLGAEVILINDEFNGMDINVQCGSTYLQPLRDLVFSSGADVGIAHDGDADRVMMMDALGNELDGDVVEAVCALDLQRRGLLLKNTAVSTIMCNLGLVRVMQDAGIKLIQTNVGDRYVLQTMREGGFVLGGEQSGHMIFLQHNSTGDGLVTALQFLAACKRMGKTVAQAASVMKRFPQTLINVQVADKHTLAENEAIKAAVKEAETALGADGRVLLRPSGTEPVVRVMVEALSQKDADEHARRVAQVVARES